MSDSSSGSFCYFLFLDSDLDLDPADLTCNTKQALHISYLYMKFGVHMSSLTLVTIQKHIFYF